MSIDRLAESAQAPAAAGKAFFAGNRALKTVVAAMLAVASGSSMGAGDDAQLLVVSTSSLTHYWAIDGKALPEYRTFSQVGGDAANSAGCVNFGFIIEKDGKPKPQGILKQALAGKYLRANDVQVMAMFALMPFVQNENTATGAGALQFSQSTRVADALQYEPGDQNPDRHPVFTSYPVVFLGKSLAQTMSDADGKRYVEQLRESCDIEDLGAWVKAHGTAKPVVVKAPELPAPAGK